MIATVYLQGFCSPYLISQSEENLERSQMFVLSGDIVTFGQGSGRCAQPLSLLVHMLVPNHLGIT